MGRARPAESVEKEIQATRPHISLDYSTYTHRHAKSRFIDAEYGEYWMTPGNALKGQEHPARKQSKMIKTSLERYGTPVPTQSEQIKKKMIERSREKHGVDWAFLSPEALAKNKQICLDRFGTEYYPVLNHPVDYTDHGEKIKNANIAKYGVASTTLIPAIRQKQIDTCWVKYGGPSSLSSAEVRQKQAISRKTENQLEADFASEFECFLRNQWFTFGNKKSELDFFSPEQSIGVELCGEYWHSDEIIHKNRHLEKKEQFARIGIQVIFVFQTEWERRRKQVVSYLRSKISSYVCVIPGRKTEIKIIHREVANVFCEENHIQGSTSGNSLNIGIFFEKVLVGVCCFGPGHRQQNMQEFFLKRLCFLPQTRVNGGLDKVLSFLKKERGISEVFTFIDRRFSDGNSFLRNKWELVGVLKPDYFYFKGRKIISKQSRRKTLVNTPVGMTELQHAKKDNLVRVWDCGKLKIRKQL